MTFGNRWFSPRTWYSQFGFGQYGDCSCCGCVCQSSTGDVDDTNLDDQKVYQPYVNGARVKIVISGMPALVEWELAAIESLGGTNVRHTINRFSLTGLDGLNGTRYVNLPISQYGCLWGNNTNFLDPVYSETIDLEITTEQTQIDRYNNVCDANSVYTDTGTLFTSATLQVDVYRKYWTVLPRVEETVFRYVAVRLYFADCNPVGGTSGWVLTPRTSNAYWPYFANDQFRLDRPFLESIPGTFYGSGVGFDCKRLASQASGSFSWTQMNCYAANDETTVANLCGETGGGDVAEVSGTVGSYTVEVERL